MEKSVSMRISSKTDKNAEALLGLMDVNSKSAVVSQSVKLTKQLSDIINNGGRLYYMDKEGNKTDLLISALQP